MNCKKVHKQLIFFVKNELPANDMQEVRQHLQSCSDCAAFAAEMKSILQVLEAEKVLEPRPYFYTRVKNRLESISADTRYRRGLSARVLQPLAFSLLLLAGILAGSHLGARYAKMQTAVSKSQELVPYWNEMEVEPLENFLMQ